MKIIIPPIINKLYRGYQKTLIRAIIVCFLVLGYISTVQLKALPSLNSFDQNPGLAMTDQDFYSLPIAFSSAERIQQFLVSQGSLLANTTFPVTLEPNSAVLISQAFADKPSQFNSPLQLAPHLGKTMRASDIIWNLSRTGMSSSCSMFFQNNAWRTNSICYDSESTPINPGFILALIQKESGMIYGSNSKLHPHSALGTFLLDRIVGYYCFENPDRSKSCFDENPDWKFYKGFFRQLYFAVRLLRLREQMCRIGGSSAFTSTNGVFQVGSTVSISGRLITLINGISCSLYIYTPHISSQRLLLQIMQELNIDRNFAEIRGLPPEYIPSLLIKFENQTPD